MKTVARLTIARVETVRIPPGKAEIKLWDGAVSGLCLRCFAGGGRSWVFRYRADGGGRSAAIRTLKLGNYPALSLDAARDAAKAHAGQVAKGLDPAQVRQEKRRRAQATLGTLLATDGLYARNLRDRRIVKAKDGLSCLRRGLARLMHIDVAKITRLDLVEALDALNELPGAQADLRKHTRTFLEWTTNNGLTPANVLAGMRRPQKTRAQRLEQSARRRALQDSDIVAVWRAAERGGKFGSFVQLALLTAMRRNEVAALRWDNIQHDRIVLSAAATKTGVAHEIPSTDLMRQILERQPRTLSPLVFPSDRTGRAMTAWVKMKERLVREADVGAWSLHDLRRTCRTLMSRCGVAEALAELAIGHVRTGLIAIYDHDQQWRGRCDAFQRVSDHVGRLVAVRVAA